MSRVPHFEYDLDEVDPEIAEFDALRASNWWQEKTHARPSLRKAVVRSDGKEYDSVGEAAADVGRHFETLSDALNGRQKTCAGFTWKFKENV